MEETAECDIRKFVNTFLDQCFLINRSKQKIGKSWRADFGLDVSFLHKHPTKLTFDQVSNDISAMQMDLDSFRASQGPRSPKKTGKP